MTTRNLNGNGIDTLRRQYVYDLKDDSPHPIKYLLYQPDKKQDLYFVITNKIEEPQLRRSLVKYSQSIRGTSDVEWENEHVKVIFHPRYAKRVERSRPINQQGRSPRRTTIRSYLSTRTGNMKLTLATALLLLAPALVKAWTFEVFDDDCTSSTNLYTSDDEESDDRECEDTPEPHGCFRIAEMGTCILTFHADADECEDGEVTMEYTNTSENMDTLPDFEWENWSIHC